MCRRAGLALLLALAACGETPDTVAVGEAPPVAFPPGRARLGDTLSADSVFADPAFADTVSAAPGAVQPDSADAVPAEAPDFNAFWTAFLAQVRAGRPPAVPGAANLRRDPFRPVVLATTARDVPRDGPEARTARAVVGFDAAGRVVPQDEAVRDSALVLRFEIADGAWRLVRARLDG